MKKAILLTMLILFSWRVSADVKTEVYNVIQNNIKYMQQENVELTMSTLHTQSPVYEATKMTSIQIFEVYDLKYELSQYNFITQDGEYAYARVVQRTTKMSGPEFGNNVIDLLHVLKKEAGKWKIWTSAPLEIQFE